MYYNPLGYIDSVNISKDEWDTNGTIYSDEKYRKCTLHDVPLYVGAKNEYFQAVTQWRLMINR